MGDLTCEVKLWGVGGAPEEVETSRTLSEIPPNLKSLAAKGVEQPRPPSLDRPWQSPAG